MGSVRVQIKLRALNELMRSQPVSDVVGDAAQRIADRAGNGFEVRESPHRWTARWYVDAETYDAKRAEARSKVLTRAVVNRG